MKPVSRLAVAAALAVGLAAAPAVARKEQPAAAAPTGPKFDLSKPFQLAAQPVQKALTAKDYAAAKAGVMAFTRCSAIEAAAHGVRINAVAPSIAMHAFLAKVTSDELLAELSAREAFGRPAEVWEIANVMIFLASDLASYMTGEVLSVSSQRA